MRGLFVVVSGAVLLLAVPAAAQKPYPECARSGSGCGVATNSTSPPMMIIPGVRQGYQPILAVRSGTAVMFELPDGWTAEQSALQPGSHIRLIVAAPVAGGSFEVLERSPAARGEPSRLELGQLVRESGIILIARGSPALGEIIHGPGRSSAITVRLLSVHVDGHDFRLSGKAQIAARPGSMLRGVLQEDVVPAQALMPRILPDLSKARVASPADLAALRAIPASPPPPTAARIAEPARARAAPASYITAADYPESALRAREEGAVAYVLDVGADGRAATCTITRSSGSTSLDATTCRIMRSRARFTPARDTNGNPAASRLNQEVTWTLPRRIAD